MAIKKSDLYASLWASGDQLRGGLDARRGRLPPAPFSYHWRNPYPAKI